MTDMTNVHARVAAVLGWSEETCKAFDLMSLRDLVRHKAPSLAFAITRLIESGAVVVGERR